ncbi:MAG TPA: GatB/YqeY domain-containing protein [Chromatiales bacterium]|nr:GatB/YqeY domain-containing protein [Chromatiales bacterium]
MPAESSPLKARITDDMKSAMRAGEKEKLGTIRLILSAIKQIEVDTRKDLDDTQVLNILDKMVKQRRESISQFEKAGRDELAAKEHQEIAIIQDYLPAQLSEAEINDLIEEAINTTGAAAMRDMGKVMGILKPKLQGRADMGAVSASIKARLSG